MSSIPPPEDVLSHGLLPNQVVKHWATDSDLLIIKAQAALTARLSKAFRSYENNSIRTGAVTERIRSTPFKVWFSWANPFGESRYQLFVAIDPDSHPKAKDVIEALPDLFDGFELFCAPWPEIGN
jgi:hypothetical protein